MTVIVPGANSTLAEGNHLVHVFDGDHRIARFPEEDAGIVPKVNHRVAHDLEALFPPAPHDVGFLVVRGELRRRKAHHLLEGPREVALIRNARLPGNFRERRLGNR